MDKMSDLISRQAAIECCDWYEHEYCECEYALRALADDLQKLPTIAPVKHGRLADGIVSFHWTCSECGCHLRKDLGQVFERETDRYNYCPNCGARMGNEEE